EHTEGRWLARAGEDLHVSIDEARFKGSLKPGTEVTVGIRPHDVRMVEAGDGASFEVSIVEALGAESYAHGSIAGVPFVARLEASSNVKKGDRVHVAFAH